MIERIEYNIGHWPDRKLPMITRTIVGSGESTIVARFVSDEAAEIFMRELGIKRERDE